MDRPPAPRRSPRLPHHGRSVRRHRPARQARFPTCAGRCRPKSLEHSRAPRPEPGGRRALTRRWRWRSTGTSRRVRFGSVRHSRQAGRRTMRCCHLWYPSLHSPASTDVGRITKMAAPVRSAAAPDRGDESDHVGYAGGRPSPAPGTALAYHLAPAAEHDCARVIGRHLPAHVGNLACRAGR